MTYTIDKDEGTVKFECVKCDKLQKMDLKEYYNQKHSRGNYQHICSDCKKRYLVELEGGRIPMIWFS